MKIRVVFLSRYQNLIQRGAEIFVCELAKKISARHQISILSGNDSDNLAEILSGNYDIVIPINGRGQSLKVSFGRLIGRYKVLISGHSGIGRDDLWNIAIVRPNVFVALTDKAYGWAKKLSFGVKVEKIPNGIDLEKFHPKGDKLDLKLQPPIILSVGALVWYKYHDRIIEAVSKLEDGSLLIVGDGPDKNKLEKAGRLKLGSRFKLQKVDYQKMPQIYRSADLFTLPSWDREAFGIVYLEAMASNLAVVAPDDLTRREIVGNGGLYTDVADPFKYSQTINDALRKNWGELPRKQAEKFSWDIIALRYEEVFQELVGQKRD